MNNGKLLPYGTRIKVIDRRHFYHGRCGWIKGDNWVDRLEPVVVDPGIIYYIWIESVDKKSVENIYAAADQIEVSQ